MIRVGKATIRYNTPGLGAPRAADASRRALEILNERLAAEGAPPHGAAVGALRVSVRVPAGASAEAVAGRVADAIARQLSPKKEGALPCRAGSATSRSF